MKFRKRLHAVLRVAAGAVFIYAGCVKAVAPAAFARAIENYQLLPHAAAVAASLYLPYLETVCGLSLIFKKAHRGALAILIFAMLVFMAALGSAWARGLNIACGCFGSAAGGSYGADLARDAALLAVLVFLRMRD